MKVLLSIKPEYANSILNGSKEFEFRKSIFKKNGVKKIIIYATKPVGKIVGEFDIDVVLSSSPNEIWEKTRHSAGITRSFFDSYFSGRKKAFAIKVKNPKRYEVPLMLNQLISSTVPPQSYRYI